MNGIIHTTLHSVIQEYECNGFFGKWNNRGATETPTNTRTQDQATFLPNHPTYFYFCYPQDFRFPTITV